MKKIKYIENGVTKTFTKEQVTNKVIKIEEVLRKLGGWVKISVLVKQSNLEQWEGKTSLLKQNKMTDIDIIKKNIKALKKHYKECSTYNTIYLRPVLKSQIESLEQTRFNLEVQQFKDFI